MPDIFVLADDLSGAAEIGGLAHMHGLSVRIVFSLDDLSGFHEQVIILDTNSRNLTPAEAGKKLSVLLSGSFTANAGLVYKKIDSVLRGPIVTEIKFLARASGKKFSCMVPANPSKNRIIQSGKYYIDNVPVSKTAFKNDPHYPRLSDDVSELVTDNTGEIVTGNDLKNMVSGRILVPDIESADDIRSFLQLVNVDDVLMAGGVDFFNEILNLVPATNKRISDKFINNLHHSHFIIGSNAPEAIHTINSLIHRGFVISRMPLTALTEEPEYNSWIKKINNAVKNGSQIVLTVPEKHIDNRYLLTKLTDRLTDAAIEVAGLAKKGSWLFVEGGETASFFCRKIGWTSFSISHAWPEGAVLLATKNPDIQIVVKPGSYRWPNELLS